MKAEQLRKSILQLAIQGKLVPQDPADEPASVLLERIRAEKQHLIKEGKIKKDKGDSVIFKGDDNCYYEKTGSEVKNITDEIPFDIPDSWCWTTIEKITFSVGSKENQIQTSQILKNGLIPVVSQSKNIIDGFSNLVEKRITKLPVIMFGDHTKVVKLIDFPFVIGADGTKFFSPVLINDKFLYYLLVYTAINLPSRGYARHYVLLKKEYLPIPPLAEQKRIVAEIKKFEPLIAEYDKYEQQATKLDGEIYDKLKKSILQYAIQGKLVPQDSNDEPAALLLERIRAEKKAQLGKKYVESYIFKGDDNCYYEKIGKNEPVLLENLPFDIPDSWCWARLKEIVTNHGQKIPDKTFSYIDIGSIDNKMQRLNSVENFVSPQNAPSRARKIVEYGDILYATVRPYLHNMAIIDKTFSHEPIASTGFAVLSCKNGVSNKYLFFYLLSPIFDLYANSNENAKGVAYPAINDEKLYNALIAIPPYNEQIRICNQIEMVLDKLKDEN